MSVKKQHGVEDEVANVGLLNSDEQPLQCEKLPRSQRIQLLSAGLLYGTERAFMVSASEAAGVFLLESELNWAPQNAGFAVGIMYIVAVPISLLANYARMGKVVNERRLMQISAA
eukprot:1006913-Pyramimonas_sp.AAC.1